MSSSKFHRNAIITGYIDCYCLVCESHLRSEDDINIHISKPIHKKNLDYTNYLDKYKDDCVRKVKKGYFCEFCNLLLTTAAKVGLHVAEAKHNDNKGRKLLKRDGNTVIAFEDILITEKAWNGLIDDTCAICNAEFDNEGIHKTEPAHILNLIQSKIEFGADKNIFRKIDESSFQCLTCNMVLASSSLTTHFDQPEHMKLLLASRQTNINATKPEGIVTDEFRDKPKSTIGNVKEPVAKDAPLFKPGFLNTANTTKKSETPIEIPKKTEKSRSHEKVTSGFDEEICEALEAKDYIAHDESGKKWCILCDWTMDTIAIDTHVYGRHHLTMLKMHRERLQQKHNSVERPKTKEPALKIEPKDVKVEKETSAEQENSGNILDSLSKYQKNDIAINFVTATAVCKKCNKSLELNCKLIELHIEEHKKKEAKLVKKEKLAPINVADVNKTDDAKKTSPVLKNIELDDKSDTRASSAASTREMDEEAEKYAKANDLMYNRNGNKVYCRICDTRVPSSLKSMKEHIAGISHKNRVAKISEIRLISKQITVKIAMRDFVKNLTGIENGFLKDVIINEKYCVNLYSFLMITKMRMDLKLHCTVCDVTLNVEQVDMHKDSPNHQRRMYETLIVASMESEFIREVNPDLYHCGYCNLTEASIEDLQAHLQCTSHRESKTSAAWRLQQYQPEVLQYRAQRPQQDLECGLLVQQLLSSF